MGLVEVAYSNVAKLHGSVGGKGRAPCYFFFNMAVKRNPAKLRDNGYSSLAS